MCSFDLYQFVYCTENESFELRVSDNRGAACPRSLYCWRSKSKTDGSIPATTGLEFNNNNQHLLIIRTLLTEMIVIKKQLLIWYLKNGWKYTLSKHANMSGIL